MFPMGRRNLALQTCFTWNMTVCGRRHHRKFDKRNGSLSRELGDRASRGCRGVPTDPPPGPVVQPVPPRSCAIPLGPVQRPGPAWHSASLMRSRLAPPCPAWPA
ncbi:hypothetical protein NCAST_27_00330 [Nocardia asteroides NBRC 15531]|uniref:Uncharacterized protein n=1 Tax=Nocardia asteroides NBRC 15531 TaxID=1110697 RepID=U5EFQ5_NOCAS|nr:hypothetical protein NCAST_27_00330 [Nocardia asteroides NBRC 15531]